VVTITGTNFKLPSAVYVPPPYNTQLSTVQVLVNGELAQSVEVLSATSLSVRMPAYRGDANEAVFPAVAIVVKNLDSAGVPIVGETGTLAAAYTYERIPTVAPAAEDDPYDRVTRELIRLYKRSVHKNVSYTTHTDYADSPYVELDVAELPSLHIVGPKAAFDSEFTSQEFVEENLPGDVFDLYDPPIVTMLEYKVIGASDSHIELLRMMTAARETLEKIAYLDVDRGGVLPRVKQALQQVEEPTEIGGPSDSNLRVFSSTIRVRGVTVLFSQARARGYKILTIEGDLMSTVGSAPETFITS
jgi:hypothetical protein